MTPGFMGAGRLLASPQWSGPQLAGNWDVIWHYAAIHARYTLVSLALGTLAAVPLAYLAHRSTRTYAVLLAATNIVYAIPSLAMFVLMFPLFGVISDVPVIVAMALYSLVILVRGMVEGLRAVPADAVTAATAMGCSRLRRFVAVELPLAVPTIVAALRVAAVSTVSMISVGGLIGKGGLGRLFADGFSRRIDTEIRAGIAAVVVLALVADAVLLGLGRAATPWTRNRARA